MKEKIPVKIIVLVFLVVVSLNAGSSLDFKNSEYEDLHFPGGVCCKKTTEGEWCQQVPEDECASSQKAPTSCNNTNYCSMGTCIDKEEGKCMRNVPVSLCEKNGGIWKSKEVNKIPECKTGCCLMGEEYLLSTGAKCEQIGSDKGINITFREDISSQAECAAASAGNPRGACVIQSETESVCSMTLKSDCVKKRNSREYLNKLENPVSDVRVKFHEGKLCTNENLETDCAPTEKTICYEDRIYFVDSCGNRANVYDSLKIDNQKYWNFIQEPDCGPVSSDSSKGVKKSCGDCSYYLSTKCQKPNSGDPEPDTGEYVCSDLSCEYDTDGNGEKETYENGESWCAETKGTVHHIKVNEDGEIIDEYQKKLMNIQEYNLPGSEYVKLTCSEGEVLETKCNSRRREICTEFNVNNSDYTVAQCKVNPASFCSRKKTKSECENNEICKWLPGLRFDQERIEGEKNRKEKQGSCVPLIPPGVEFWNPDSSSTQSCSLGNNPSVVFYEVHWMESRRRMGEGEGSWDAKRKASNCFKGTCAAIPYYGQKADEDYKFSEDVDREGMRKLWKGDKTAGSLVSSRRQGHYCKKSEEKDKTGGTGIGKIHCLPDKRVKPPVFLTHSDFMNFIRIRARSLGDCGLKENIAGDSGSSDSETYQRIFQKVEMEEGEEPKVKENVTGKKDIYSEKQLRELWKGGNYETYYGSHKY